MKKPAIRFKGYTGEWIEKTLGDVASAFDYGLNAAATNYDGKNKYIRITDIDDRSHRFSQENLSSPDTDLKNADNYLVKSGDILFARTGASVGKSYLYNKDDGKVYYAGFLIRASVKDGISPDFVFQNTMTDNYKRFVKITSQRSGQPGVNAAEYKTYSFLSPKDKTEQASIGLFFKNLDSLIEGKLLKLDKLKKLKQAYLGKMFPQKGSRVPEVRFKGFTGEWTQYSFKNITFRAGEKNKENRLLDSYSISNERGFVLQDEQFENGGTMRNADKSMYIIVPPESFAYNPARINIGSIGYQNVGREVIVSSLYEVFKTTDQCYDRFLWHWFKSPFFTKLVEVFQEGGVRLYFYYDKLCMCNILLPSVDEQKKIAAVFDNLDTLIALQQKELDKLTNIKSACLSKMFA